MSTKKIYQVMGVERYILITSTGSNYGVEVKLKFKIISERGIK